VPPRQSRRRCETRLCSGRRLAAVAAALLVLLVGAAPASARQRAVRQVLDARTSILDLAQDREGVIWLATTSGLLRFDGTDVRPVQPGVITRPIDNLWIAPDGAVWVGEQGGLLYRVLGDSAELVLDDDGEPLTPVIGVAFDPQGRTWVIRGRDVLRRERGGAWQLVLVGALAGERPDLLHATATGDVYVATSVGLWRVVDDRHALRLCQIFLPEAMISDPDGTAWLADDNFVRRVRGMQVDEVLDQRLLPKSAIRFADLARRGDSIWVVYDYGLAVIRDDGFEEVQFAASPWSGRSDLLVDAEGSLWVGHPRGLYQFPEPDTIWWNEREGLPLSDGRFVARNDEGVWVAAWSGAALVRPPGAPERVMATSSRPLIREQPCLAGDGTLWLTPGEGLLARRNGHFDSYPLRLGGGARCAQGLDGSLWVLRGTNLVHVGIGGELPVELPHAWGEQTILPASVLVDSQDRLWLAQEKEVCQGDSRGLGPWTCTPTPGKTGALARSLVETEEGDIWLAVRGEGVFRFTGDGWTIIDSSLSLPSRWVGMMHRSPRGGVWVLGQNFTVRVQPDADGAHWQVVEQLSQWHGMGNPGASDLLEDPDGRLWLASPDAPLLEIPPRARFDEAGPPRVQLLGAHADGRELPHGGGASLPAGVERIELEFRALSYREPARLRYRMRLGPDEPWSAPSATGTFNLVGAAAGDYQLEVAASLDGARWSEAPARYDFSVAAPWYQLGWVWVGFATLAAGLLYLAHAARLQVLLRLQRQRLRIARDLHDEMGSGLGSIGILSEVMSHEDVDDVERRELGARIHGTVGSLSTALQDIVWSLRTGSEQLAALPVHLKERGAALMAGKRTSFRADVPDELPSLHLALPVRRNVQLIALEALHNAAKHAEARQVTLGLRPLARSVVHLWIEDDGCGLGQSARAPGSGMGLDSMRKRAGDLRGELRVSSSPGRGTRIDLWFHADGQPAAGPPGAATAGAGALSIDGA